ncbi:hypothetical protein Bca4012_037852 [Brassica carinata]
MNFFETYEFSSQLTTKSSRKPISEKDLTSLTFHLISNHTREGVLQEPSLSLKSYMGKLSISLGHETGTLIRTPVGYPSTKLLPFAQMGVVGQRFSGEIELRYLIGKTLMEPLSYASSE